MAKQLGVEPAYGVCYHIDLDEAWGGKRSLELTTRPLALLFGGATNDYADLRTRADFGCVLWASKEGGQS